MLILATVAASLPFGESLAAYGRRAAAARSGKKNYRRGSRAWHRRRRAHLRRQRAIAAARRRRQRAWVLRRRRAAARRPVTARRAYTPKPQSLRTLLTPMKLPTASPSAVESVQSIELKVAAAPQPPAPQLSSSQFAARELPAPQLVASRLPVARSLAQPAAPRVLTASPAPPARIAGTPAQRSAAPLVTAAPGAAAAPAIANNHATRVAAPPAAAAPLAGATPFASPAPFAATAAPAAALPAQRLTGLPVPRSWQAVSSTLAGEFKFSVRTAEGRSAGAAVWSRVNAPAAAGHDRRNKTLGGVSHTALRRTVIDRMIAEGGWVVNDFEREVGGRRVFVVVAQSEGERGSRRNWTYYFTEADGLVYSLATISPAEFADAVAADAAQTLAAIASRPAAPAAARKK